ncbi:MAG: tetratricopeptide repeat protein [Gammaproteobacteria bacterium]|nr:tetratricopeptide repeat protein [Gammaproteobacteria bacterium]
MSFATTTGLVAQTPTVVEQAHQLIEQGDSRGALALLRPLQYARGGQPEYDYPLALALLDSGSYAESILVFERLLLANPSFHGARLDMARAWLGMENYVKASEQLDLLANTRPPEKARNAIAELRQVIKVRSRASRFSRYLNVHTAAGYDSNVNSATVAENFLGFDLDAQSREQDSDFFAAGLNAGMGYRFSRRLALTAAVGLQHRSNSLASFVDSTVSTLNVGLTRRVDGDTQMLRLSAYDLKVDGDSNSRGVNLSGIWLRRLTDDWKIGITGDFGIIRYGDKLKVKDVNRGLLGLMGSLDFGPDKRGALSVRIGYGTEDPEQADSRYARDFGYASASLTWIFSPRVRSHLSMYYQDSSYDEVFFEQRFTAPRADDLYRGIASLDWMFRPNWTFSHTLSYSLNDTFVDIFAYERFEAKVRINYQFH